MRLAAAVLAGLLLVTGCGVPQDDAPRPLDREAAPFRVFERDPAPTPTGGMVVELWFVRDDRLVPVQRPVQEPGAPEQVLDTLLDGVAETERSAGLRSAIPSAVSVRDVTVRDGIAVVTFADVNEQVQVLAFAQIVATLTGRPEVEGVRFRAGDRDLQVPRGDGSLTDAPVDRSSYAGLLGSGQSAPAVPPPPVAPTGPAPAPAEPTGGSPATG